MSISIYNSPVIHLWVLDKQILFLSPVGTIAGNTQDTGTLKLPGLERFAVHDATSLEQHSLYCDIML